jgi:hypothetical protein
MKMMLVNGITDMIVSPRMRGRDRVIFVADISWDDNQLSMEDACKRVRKHMYDIGDQNSEVNVYQVHIFQEEVF